MVDLEKYEEIIIWGASFSPSETGELTSSHGYAMDRLSDLLRENNNWKKVVAIVDSNKDFHGKKRIGIEVLDPKIILEHEKALVVINSNSINSIKHAFDIMGAKNDCAVIPFYYYHGTLDHPYNIHEAKIVAEKYEGIISRLYNTTDKLTSRYLEIISDIRLNEKNELFDISFYDETGEKMDYFCDSDLAPKGDVTYIDVGAFDGDSLAPVRRYYRGRLKKYMGFEPNEQALEKLKTYIDSEGMNSISDLFPYALGKEDGQIRFSVNGLISKESEKGSVILNQKRFDNMHNIGIIGDALVKMDIEGAELDALEGMRHFIEDYKPYLAICLYHREKDLYEIAKYIKEVDENYFLYIRGGWHLECWAVPKRHFVG